MKFFSKAVLALYLLILLWLVLFKFSFDLSAVLDYQTRNLNLIPFADSSGDNLREVIYNFIVFIPLGLLLSVNFKRTVLRQKLTFIFALSLALETIQFALAIGVTDITDIITNSLGGFLGLVLYELGRKYVRSEKRDRLIVVVCAILLIAFIPLRVLVFTLHYHSAPRLESDTLLERNIK